ncbi:hypothetical protein ACFL47_05130 [Candidatus Latescibacterota bacterium]
MTITLAIDSSKKQIEQGCQDDSFLDDLADRLVPIIFYSLLSAEDVPYIRAFRVPIDVRQLTFSTGFP